MLFQGDRVDGSWELTIAVTDIPVEKTLRVKGDVDYVGGVMFKLVEALDIPMDWSDHALWWPERKIWLKHTRLTLDQYGVQADARLEFTPMHKMIRVQLPDLQILDLKVDFSINVFQAVIKICREIGIRRPEELSILRKLEREDLKKNNNNPWGGAVSKKKRERLSTNGSIGSMNNSNNHLSPSGSMDGSGSPQVNRSPIYPSTPQGTLHRLPSTPVTTPFTFNPNSPIGNGMSSMHSLSFEGAMESTLANSPHIQAKEGLLMLHRPKSFSEKARINCGWLDSSRSLYEQQITENDLILLRFKFLSFYDLNPKYDAVRINQVYEQAKWALISEEVDCTEEEMMMFAALQLQIQMQACNPHDMVDGNGNADEDDDIDAALTDLQISLEGSTIAKTGGGDITRIPELADYLTYVKVKKFSLKTFKRCWFTFKDTVIAMHRTREEAPTTQSLLSFNLRGCEIQPDVNISTQKYGIKLFVPSPGGMSEILLRCETEHQYTHWMAACRLAARGKTMADSTYDTEVQSIQAFLNMQHPAQAPDLSAGQTDFKPEDLVAPRFLKKLRQKQLNTRILEAQANVQHMSLTEAKMNFIKAWQALPEYGITYFIVKFKGNKKEELLGIASNRMIRMDLSTGDSLKTWRFSTMGSWNVNWEVKQVRVLFEEENVAFVSLTAGCKVVHEFIGGYIFCSMRSSEKNQTLDEEMFHKLTGGWD